MTTLEKLRSLAKSLNSPQSKRRDTMAGVLYEARREVAGILKEMEAAELCSDCPPVGYPTDKTRCTPCPRGPLRQGIYIASKVKHAARWRILRSRGVPIISTWIDEAGEGETLDHDDLWRRCITEASCCKGIVVYREPDEILKGAWIELGAALRAGVPVYAAGLEQYTIAKYREIKHFPNVDDAIAAALAVKTDGDRNE